jgi:hypothetical protein
MATVPTLFPPQVIRGPLGGKNQLWQIFNLKRCHARFSLFSKIPITFFAAGTNSSEPMILISVAC